jgi:hypothetical protein
VPYLTWPAARVAINGFGLVFVGDEEDSLRFQSRTRGRRRMCNASGFRNLPPVTGPPHSKTIKSAPFIPNPGAQKPAASPYLPPIQAMASTHCHLTPRVICTWMPRICHPIASPARLYYKPVGRTQSSSSRHHHRKSPRRVRTAAAFDPVNRRPWRSAVASLQPVRLFLRPIRLIAGVCFGFLAQGWRPRGAWAPSGRRI